nr:immunoglobulin heavy chain junction region [Macaca mulatta]
CARGVISDLW